MKLVNKHYTLDTEALRKGPFSGLEQLLPKGWCGHILRGLTCPLLEVRQAEIEAGDCEGRLPLLFRRSSRPCLLDFALSGCILMSNAI
jgi:hypothetical protein